MKMKPLTIVYTTAREHCAFEWFLDSLGAQLREGEQGLIQIVRVDFDARPFAGAESRWRDGRGLVGWKVSPKPTLWQGPHKEMVQDWWANSNARNTGLCLAGLDSEWVWFLDDRCVLAPSCMEAVRAAMEGNYVVFGAYEKRVGMKVENGRIKKEGTRIGTDGRLEHCEAMGLGNPFPCGGEWGYGCSMLMPVNWALQVGGFEEQMDGLGFEDVIFGLMLQNNGYPLRYDTRLMMIEDRTREFIGKTLRREDCGVSPDDKSHRSLKIFGTARNTSNRANLLQQRKAVLEGRPFPALLGPREDWWDGAEIRGTVR
jgi:hypothetical protein